jgi:flagellar basal-body rod protein FlgF
MDTIQLIDAALSRDLQHLNRVSQNVANVNTHGYLSVHSFDQALSIQAQTNISTDSAGVRDTGRSLDVAILGPAFFRIQLNGEELLTRNGRFHINAEGFLAHSSGGVVLGERGPIAIKADSISISADGWVSEAGMPVSKLSLSSSQALTGSPYGHGLYVASEDSQIVETYSLKVAALNASNVNAGAESVRLMELSRHIQSLQKAAAAYDLMLSNGINEIGKR